MDLKQIPLSGTGFRGKMLNDYTDGASLLKPYYAFDPKADRFSEVITARKKFPVNRKVLVDELTLQHAGLEEKYPETFRNIHLLHEENTFTLTTGHQLCLAGGPMYFIYKLFTVINLAEQLRSQFPDCKFVPVYWMATEDHDFEEIAGLNIAGKEIRWEHSEGGATGRMNTRGLSSFFSKTLELLEGLPGTDRLKEAIANSYLKVENFAEATRLFVLEFFGEYGLVVIDADRPAFKKEFTGVIAAELTKQDSFRLVTEVNTKLAGDYSLQVNPREINLFYLEQGLRKRILKSGDQYEVSETHLRFSREELIQLVQQHPEKFSPNVILRPIYQEVILPNLAYSGGPAETAYWLQIKPVFDFHNVFYPLLVPRNHAVILDVKKWRRWEKLNLGYEDLFHDEDQLVKEVLKQISGRESLTSEATDKLKTLYAELSAEAAKIDSTLVPAVEARLQQSLNKFDKLERKFRAALRKRHEVSVRHIQEVVQMVKPEGKHQERTTTFMTMYANYGETLFSEIKAAMQPFSDRLTVIHP